MFDRLMSDIDQEILSNIFRSATSLAAFEKLLASLPQILTHQSIDDMGSTTGTAGNVSSMTNAEAAAQQIPENTANVSAQSFRRDTPKVGRNDSCPCGSGKKFKHCCGK